MKVIMTGGGTGGHIYPAIAIADKIKEQNPDTEVLFVGTEKGLERELVPKNGYKIRFITVSGFNRKKLFKNIKVAADLAKGNRQAKTIIKEFKPDIVIGTGGYVCGPVVRAAHKKGIKTFIHEQNAFPGMTNKILEKYVDKIFLGFDEAKTYFKQPHKLIFAGNPVRQVFFEADKSACRKALGLASDDFSLLCFGGSRGAGRINQAMLDVIEIFSGMEHFHLYMATGSVNYDDVHKQLAVRGIETAENIHIMRYIDKMDLYLKAADLVISRAGALTVAEIAVCGVPSVLIPSPNVTGNHQYYNAKTLSDVGGAVLIEEKNLDSEELISIIMKLINNRRELTNMSLKVASVAPREATKIIYDNMHL